MLGGVDLIKRLGIYPFHAYCYPLVRHFVG